VKMRKEKEKRKKSNEEGEEEGRVFHIPKGEKYGSFAVLLTKMYGCSMIEEIPFGTTSTNTLLFDGRIRIEPIMKYLPQVINSPKRQLRVFECVPLSANDRNGYDDFCQYFGEIERAGVIDKESSMGILLYFIPPKLAKQTIDFSKEKENKEKEKEKDKKRNTKMSEISKQFEQEQLSPDFLQHFPKGPFTLQSFLNLPKSPKKFIWLISITNSDKSLLYQSKMAKHEQTDISNDPNNNNIITSKKEQEQEQQQEQQEQQQQQERAHNSSDMLSALTQLYDTLGSS